MTFNEAREFLIDISYKLGNMSVEYLTEKDGEKMRDAISVLVPNQRTGKWIKSRDRYGNNHFTCPFCEYDIATKYDGAWGDNYCSDCGAKMEGESE